MQLLCSTGAFSRFPDYTQYEAILEYGPQLDVDGLELMFYPAWYDSLERIAADLHASGLTFPVMHSEKNIGVALGRAQEREQGVRWLAANCWLGSRIGARVLVLHLWGWPELDDDLDINLERLHDCIDIAARHGIELAIETIPCRRFDPLSNVHRAVQHDGRSRIALDTEFLAKHQQIETVFTTDWLWQEPLVRHAHIKDYDGEGFSTDGSRRYLHPGEGGIDFARFFAGLKQCDFTGTISLEAPAIDQGGHVDLARLRASLASLRKLIDT